MLLVCRFRPGPDPAEVATFLDRGRRAVALLGAQEGCLGVELGCGVDDRGTWVLVATFASVTAYRRALSPFEVREHVVPWLSLAETDATATFERRLSAGPGGVLAEHESLLAPPERPGH